MARSDANGKKRKRASDGDSQPRKRSSTIDPDDGRPDVAYCAHKPLLPEDASRILLILEKYVHLALSRSLSSWSFRLDNQGLLERTFPLQGNERNDRSLRSLLEEAEAHSLTVLRVRDYLCLCLPFSLKNYHFQTAVNNLLPISSHPRSRPSAPAAQQARFVHTALSLIDQASYYNVPLPDASFDQIEKQVADTSYSLQGRKYALLQHLPTGEYWSSLNSVAETDLKDLPTGHAELVSILPDPPSTSTQPIPTLGAYALKVPEVYVPPRSLPLRRGSFLDYGDNTSFAPTFDTDAGEVDQAEVAQFYWWREQSKRARDERMKQQMRNGLEPSMFAPSEDVEMDDVERPAANGVVHEEDLDPTEKWKDILSPEDLAALRSGLQDLDLERQVQILLDHNTRAIERLEELQATRISQGGIPIEGSEEWNTGT